MGIDSDSPKASSILLIEKSRNSRKRITICTNLPKYQQQSPRASRTCSMRKNKLHQSLPCRHPEHPGNPDSINHASEHPL